MTFRSLWHLPLFTVIVFVLFLCAMWRGRPSGACPPTAFHDPAASGAPSPTSGRAADVGATTGAAAHRRRVTGARRGAPPARTMEDTSDGSAVTDDEDNGAAAAVPSAWILSRDGGSDVYTAVYARKSRKAAPALQTCGQARW